MVHKGNGAAGFRRVVPIAALAAVVTLLAACGSNTTASAGANAPIRIGVQFGDTGVNAAFDTVYQDAAKIVFKSLTSINGHKVEIYYADDASDPATAVSVARRFISQDKVNIFYGPGFTPTALSTMQVAQSEHIPFYTPASINPGLTSPLKKYVFAAQFSANDVADGIAKLVNSMQAKKVGMLVENDAYGQAALAGAKTALAKYNLAVNATEQISSSATDATSQILALKNAGAQVILLGTTAPPMAAAINAEIHQSAFIPLITFAGSTTALDQLAESNPNIKYYALTPLACPIGAACTQSFLQAWNPAYPNTKPIVWTVQAYAAAQAFVNALKHAKSFTTEGLVQALQNMPSFQAPELPCPIQFSATSHKGNSCTSFYGITSGKVSFFGSDLADNKLGG